jgi:uncharacterized membrane protein (DUF485 family)
VQQPGLLSQVRHRRHRIAFSFASVTSTAFFAYLCMLKLRPELMGSRVSFSSHFTWAIVTSIAMICLVIVISVAYVLVTRKWLDPLIRQLRQSVREG